MSMKKCDVKDVTIRNVGDVSKIGYGDTAKSGADQPGGFDVAAPNTSGQPSGAKSGPLQTPAPSVYGLPPGSGGADAALEQPSYPAASEADSVQTSPNGQGVNWPAGADTMSAGGAKMAGDSLMLKTGSKVSYPSGADCSAKVMDVETFG
jgi:hypothetical protein